MRPNGDLVEGAADWFMGYEEEQVAGGMDVNGLDDEEKERLTDSIFRELLRAWSVV